MRLDGKMRKYVIPQQIISLIISSNKTQEQQLGTLGRLLQERCPTNTNSVYTVLNEMFDLTLTSQQIQAHIEEDSLPLYEFFQVLDQPRYIGCDISCAYKDTDIP